MLFSSISFLYYFLPIVLILYFIAPGNMKNLILMISSLVFYAWGEPEYVVIMIVSIIVGYITGRLIETFYTKKYVALFLAGGVLSHLGILIYFKYVDFFIGNVNAITGSTIPLLRLTLPIGISFYTFQILSYEIDVYRGKVRAQKNILKLAVYVTMFPQLIAGPIVRYSDIEGQLDERSQSFENFGVGMSRFVIGLGKKILLANTLGELCEIFKASNDKSILFFWVYGIAFALHIYFDFSGYSDMAIGLGKIFGFAFPENFNYPYISGSVTEFWRRWHMSLGQWFRDYVYIPLGGSRCSKVRWLMNILIVWMLTGLWHGAAWNFVFWGLYYGLLLAIEKLLLAKWLENSRIISHIYLLLTLIIGFVIFNGTDIRETVTYIGAMFGFGDYPLIYSEFIYYVKSYGILLVCGAVGATPIVRSVAGKMEKKSILLQPAVLVLILLISTAYLVDGSFNPFLYFRF
ncbi:MAG: MBOAT family O-acyltransferase [Frisingicoccus sp.]|nr:MBOAT family O-acyltransferase [Frisingicoccus sp.]